jgi:cysteate synthase
MLTISPPGDITTYMDRPTGSVQQQTRYDLTPVVGTGSFQDILREGADSLPLDVPAGSTTMDRPGFLRSRFRQTGFRPDTSRTDIFRYASWLPVSRILDGGGGPVTWRSEGYGPHLGLKNLYITFSGWWPHRGARIPTGTFKENEAYAVYGRMGDAAYRHTLVVASAGNTARAFLRVATEHNLPLVIVVPEDNLPDLWTVGPRGPSTTVVAAARGADYSDAIALAGLISAAPGFLAEGGAKNVARRDGMGTTFLSAAEGMGRIPDHYFQAVGSGTGAIAAWEANLRLLEAEWPAGDTSGAGPDSTVPHHTPGPGPDSTALHHTPDPRPGLARLHLAQNAPFTLMVDTWNARSATLLPLDPATAKRQIEEIDAKVLANRHAPWSPAGGLFDALTATDGLMYAPDNAAAVRAARAFQSLEGSDIAPAAAVACAALEEAVAAGTVQQEDYISLNITGGGYTTARKELDTYPLTADIVVDPTHHTSESIARILTELRDTRTRRKQNVTG